MKDKRITGKQMTDQSNKWMYVRTRSKGPFIQTRKFILLLHDLLVK
jgi:hypothetical protein